MGLKENEVENEKGPPIFKVKKSFGTNNPPPPNINLKNLIICFPPDLGLRLWIRDSGARIEF